MFPHGYFADVFFFHSYWHPTSGVGVIGGGIYIPVFRGRRR
jgi:hypothetical protein